jgi:hypothetical protein
MVHDGEMRRSEEEFGELMRRGTSATLCRDMLASEWLLWWPGRMMLVGASAAWSMCSSPNDGWSDVAVGRVQKMAETPNPRSQTTTYRLLPGDPRWMRAPRVGWWAGVQRGRAEEMLLH